MSLADDHGWKKASVSPSIRLYKCPNWLPRTPIVEIMAWICHYRISSFKTKQHDDLNNKFFTFKTRKVFDSCLHFTNTSLTDSFAVIGQSFELILSGRCSRGWTASFFLVDCPSKLHKFYSIIEPYFWKWFTISDFSVWPFFETLLARSYLMFEYFEFFIINV